MAWGKKKSQGYSYFGTNVTLEGRLCFSGVIRLDGRVNGDIVSNGSLIVEETAVITGNVLVETLVLSGTVYGNIKAFKHVQLNSISKVYGHISYGELSLEGALHEGSSHKLTAEEIEAVQRECQSIMEEAAGNAEKSRPDEVALEQFTSSVAVSAEKQTSVLLGKKPELPSARKSHAHHHGKASPGLKQAAAAGKTEGGAQKAEVSEAAKNASAARTVKSEAGPAKAPASGTAQSKKPEGANNGQGEALKAAESLNGNGPAAAKKAEPQKNWESIRKTNVPPKKEGPKEGAETPEAAKKSE